MSKAFTSEETPDLVSAVREPPRMAPGEVRYITPEGRAALRAEIERLRLPGGPSVAEDRARRKLLLERTLAVLTELGPESAPAGKVGFGTWVTVEDEEGGRDTWRIVGPDEADARRGAVSVHAPLGRALLGRGEGETVEVVRPGGVRTYTILGISRRAPSA